MIWFPHFLRIRRRSFSALILLTTSFAAAQSNSDHVFQVARADLEKALAAIRATAPGRLPILDGFVAPDIPALDKYQRAYYQYKFEIRPLNGSSSSLHVSAKVTAWFTGDKNTPAGYRALPSNGRLESDLIERLDEALQQKSADAATSTSPAADRSPTVSSSEGTVSAAPQNSSTSRALTSPPPALSPFGRALSSDQSVRPGFTPPDSRDLAQEKHVQQLTEQAANLEEILRNQARPNDLAAIRHTGTPVLAKPIEPGETLFLADAEDEFKILDETGGWVHVQVSGISRGWIRRSELEMPGESTPSAEAVPALTSAPAKLATHEETSLFPGEWSALRGHIVRITWVRPDTPSQSGAERWQMARAVFRDTYRNVTRDNLKVDGITIVIDSADGGMIAATSDALRRWNTGALSDAAFRKECWADSPEAMGETAKREGDSKSQVQ